VENIYTPYNFSRFAIYLPKYIKVSGNLTTSDRNKNAQFFYIHLYFTKEMVVGLVKTQYNIINKENTISKHKVNMTISIVKNMTIKVQSILE